MNLSKKRAMLALSLTASFTLAACGGGQSSSGSGSGTTAATASGGDAAAASSAAASTTKVDANNASAEELTQAFEAAGIPSADRWAREVQEYRPYPTDDPTFAKLRQELSKYNPSDAVVEQIIASLSL